MTRYLYRWDDDFSPGFIKVCAFYAKIAPTTLAKAYHDAGPHRMACARCDFYTPKASAQGQLLEAKDNL